MPQSLGSSAGLRDAILLSFRRTRSRRSPSIYMSTASPELPIDVSSPVNPEGFTV
jgi:hypothetical protein